MKNELADPTARVACIGPAGERLVKIACIVSDKGHGVAGRCGLGAVMGSKNLKAIALRGRGEVNLAAPDELKRIVKEIVRKIPEKMKIFHDHGTPGFLDIHHARGEVPVKYWARGEWSEGVEKLGTPNYTEEILVRPMVCSSIMEYSFRRREFLNCRTHFQQIRRVT